MNLLLGFSPFLLFATLEHLLGVAGGLAAAAAASSLLVLGDLRAGEPKLLEMGTLALFAGLGAWAATTGAKWPVLQVRLAIDSGLLAIMLLSLLLRRPFTLPYARQQAPREVWALPTFLRMNMVLSTVWALAFVIVTGADLMMLLRPEWPLAAGIATTVAALAAALRFTGWYPDRLQARRSGMPT